MIQSLTVTQAYELVSRGGIDVIDVRDPAEWSAGHLPGARLVPLDQLRRNPAAALARDGVLFVCASGIRSQAAARIAASQGLTAIYNLSSGTRGWSNAGLPLVNELPLVNDMSVAV
jgi:rhodanese-related sulfurtransferase